MSSPSSPMLQLTSELIEALRSLEVLKEDWSDLETRLTQRIGKFDKQP